MVSADDLLQIARFPASTETQDSFPCWTRMPVLLRAPDEICKPLCLDSLIHPHGCLCMGFPGGSVVENPPANAGDDRDMGLIPGSGRSPGGGDGNPLQSSCLQNPMDRGAWQATVHRVPGNRTRLKQHGMHAMSMYIYIHLTYIYASSIYQSRISCLSISYLCYLPMYPPTYFCISVSAC